ncbi:helix-turn-helix domain-containing protein [Paenibacillus ginsengarvi]|uniref:AraC family transcriptional regulator n=1 Tax=Paenibacillus ginsengarvi TaxID=400777 RepID=A0A3B0C951_9BACL|nr:helix-turn-helix domain-containing protein [Paenibacillus ginsengarvi]RKN79256.1 AraC family transcriptional regulator [Paenibacillus ginsengarvi]
MHTVTEREAKGVLQLREGAAKFSLTRHAPAPELAWMIKHYWIVKWDLRGQRPYPQVVLSHPNVNLVFEKNTTRVYGITKTSETRIIEGRGIVLGVKFRPGGFYPLWQKPVAELAGTSIPFRDVFGFEPDSLESDLLEQPEQDEEEMIRRTDRFFLSVAPARDEQVAWVDSIVDTILRERDIVKVDQLVRHAGVSKRTIQRLFSRYVGVSPKWVIQRYRLHEAALRVEQGEQPDWAKLSIDMGYYDQAHFIKDFKAIIGKSPEQYMREKQGAS